MLFVTSISLSLAIFQLTQMIVAAVRGPTKNAKPKKITAASNNGDESKLVGNGGSKATGSAPQDQQRETRSRGPAKKK